MLVFKHLHRRNWDITVLSLQLDYVLARQPDAEEWNGVRVIRVDPKNARWRIQRRLRLLQRLLRGTGVSRRSVRLQRTFCRIADGAVSTVGKTLSLPDRYYAARSALLKTATEIEERNGVDAVASLYHPISAHTLASTFARRYRLPWLAFTKDFYSWPADLVDGGLRRNIVNRIKRRYETHVLRDANAVLAVNDNLRDYLRSLLPLKRIATLPHCYDDDDFTNQTSSTRELSLPFRLVSVGRVAQSEEDGLHMLFAAIQRLLDDGSIDPALLRLAFVGHGEHIVRTVAGQYQLDTVLETQPSVPHEEAIEYMTSATCLLFQQAPWGNRRRLPEYFATRKPIIAFPSYPNTMSERLLQQYGCARIADSEDGLRRTVASLYRKSLYRACPGSAANDQLVASFAASRRAEALDRELLETTNQQRR